MNSKDEEASRPVGVSMPVGLIAAVRAHIEARGFSAYVSTAVERRLERDLLKEAHGDEEAKG